MRRTKEKFKENMFNEVIIITYKEYMNFTLFELNHLYRDGYSAHIERLDDRVYFTR